MQRQRRVQTRRRTTLGGLIGTLLVLCCGLSMCSSILSPSSRNSSTRASVPTSTAVVVGYVEDELAMVPAAPAATAPFAAAEVPTITPDVPALDVKAVAAPATPKSPALAAQAAAPVAPTDIPIPIPASSDEFIRVAGVQAINIRAKPSTDAAIVGQLWPGQVATVLARLSDGSWTQVDHDNTIGWIRSDLIQSVIEGEMPDMTRNTAPLVLAPTAEPTIEPYQPPPPPTDTPYVPPAPAVPAPSGGGGGGRTGAICNDGSTSAATGRGACSHHGGVARWLP